MSSEGEIRSSWKEVWGGKLAGWLIWFIGTTQRKSYEGWKEEYGDPKNQYIHVFWHGHICLMFPLFSRMFKKRMSNTVALASASKDGAAIEAAVKIFGIGTVRGSSSRRGVAALIALKKAAKEGKDVIITPDGPRGPRHVLQPGVVKLAQTTGMKVLPMTVVTENQWQLGSWDKMKIPKPFSKVTLRVGEALEFPRKLDENEFEAARLKLEQVMLEGLDEQLN